LKAGKKKSPLGGWTVGGPPGGGGIFGQKKARRGNPGSIKDGPATSRGGVGRDSEPQIAENRPMRGELILRRKGLSRTKVERQKMRKWSVWRESTSQ